MSALLEVFLLASKAVESQVIGFPYIEHARKHQQRIYMRYCHRGGIESLWSLRKKYLLFNRNGNFYCQDQIFIPVVRGRNGEASSIKFSSPCAPPQFSALLPCRQGNNKTGFGGVFRRRKNGEHYSGCCVCLQCYKLLRIHVNRKKATQTNGIPINEPPASLKRR